MISESEIRALRLKRQFLSSAVPEEEYDNLFRLMSPVPVVYWSEPGNPPTLPGHTDFDDYKYNSMRRARRSILKGRFSGGNIGYVDIKDLEIMACVFKKPLKEMTKIQEDLLDILHREGPMNIGLMKELTGLRVKDITPGLHKLQEAFELYEDQIDNEGDRGWFLFKQEFTDTDISKYGRIEALTMLIPRAASLLVFFDEDMLKSCYRLPSKDIRQALSALTESGSVVSLQCEGKWGYMLAEDYERMSELVGEAADVVVPPVIILQRNDFMVRAFEHELKPLYTTQWDKLYYVMVEGSFCGAVAGKFRYGPPDIEDIVVNLPPDDCIKYREAVMAALEAVCGKDRCCIIRYDGKPLIG